MKNLGIEIKGKERLYIHYVLISEDILYRILSTDFHFRGLISE